MMKERESSAMMNPRSWWVGGRALMVVDNNEEA